MFIQHSSKPKHPFVGVDFRLRKSVDNMSGTFEKDTILKCTEVKLIDGKVLAVSLADEFGNGLLLNKLSFETICTDVL